MIAMTPLGWISSGVAAALVPSVVVVLILVLHASRRSRVDPSRAQTNNNVLYLCACVECGQLNGYGQSVCIKCGRKVPCRP